MPRSVADGSGRKPRRARTERTLRWRFTAGLARPVVESFAPLRIHDGDKLPTSGAFILTPNHITDFDPVVMGLAMWELGRVPRFLAKASLFKVPVLGNLLRWLGQIPVERSTKPATGSVGSARPARGRGRAGRPTASRTPDPLRAANTLIRNGWAVIIYPEGTLTREPDLWPMRGRTGAVRAALDAGIPIIPAAHWGAQRVLPRWGKRIHLLPRHRVEVLIGDPFDLSPWRDAPRTHETYEAATAALMQEIARLVGQLRGETPPTELWDPSRHGQTEFGRP